MAIEFRDRAWLSATHLSRTVALLAELGAGAVIIDELKHELFLEDPPLTVWAGRDARPRTDADPARVRRERCARRG